MNIVLKFLIDNASHIDMNSILEPKILNMTSIPQVMRIVSVTGCVAKPLNRLISITAVDDKHLISDVHVDFHRQRK